MIQIISMSKEDALENKDRFLRAYSNVPLGMRNEIILLVDDKPITWDVAFIEIENSTGKGKEILKKLIQLELI
ncbi:MAG TPA: hypothetical protein VI968_00820 [archaeon]|nr:hypothetical protein [archaeon]